MQVGPSSKLAAKMVVSAKTVANSHFQKTYILFACSQLEKDILSLLLGVLLNSFIMKLIRPKA